MTDSTSTSTTTPLLNRSTSSSVSSVSDDIDIDLTNAKQKFLRTSSTRAAGLMRSVDSSTSSGSVAHPNKDDEDEDNHDALIADHNDHVLHFQRRLNVQEHESDELSRPVFPPSKAAVVRYLRDLFPPLEWLPKYNLTKFQGDAVAGLTLTIMLIPQAVAYALLAGLPAEYGLYSCSIPLFVYAMFGTSRELNVGPVAIVSLIAFEALEAAGFRSCDLSECKAAPPLADPMCNQCIVDQTAWNQASIVLAFLSGLLQVVCGLLHLGVLATFLAQPVITGFNFASAILIAGSQLKSVFGVKVESQSTIFETIYYCFKAAFFDGAMKWAALGTWIVATLILFITQKLNQRLKTRVPIPGPLIIIVLGTVVSYASRFDAPIVGALPSVYPLPTSPNLQFVRLLLPGSALVAFVGLIGSLSLSSVFARKKGYEVNASQELVALGMSSTIGSLFSSMPVTGSLSRSVVADGAGTQTQMYGVVNALLCLLLGFALPLIQFLPHAVFAAIIMFSCVPLLKVGELTRLWKIDKRDWFTTTLTIVVTLLLGVDVGLVSSIAVSLLLFVHQAASGKVIELGLVPGTDDIWKDIHRFTPLQQFANVAIVRFDAPMFFANVKHFEEMLAQIARRDPRPFAIVVDCSAITSCDSTAAVELQKMLQEYRSPASVALSDVPRVLDKKPPIDVSVNSRCILVFACLKHSVRHRLRLVGIDLKTTSFAMSIRDAIDTLADVGCLINPPWRTK